MTRDFRTIAAVGGLLAGFAYYLCFRWLQLPLTDVSAGSFPSFVFVFSFGLLLPKLPTKLNPLLFALAPLLLISSCTYGPNGPNITPVYMSYAELRASVAVEDPQPMSQMGRLVIYQDHLFVNELNKGLHVIDNTDPSSPEAIAFIKIPGNTDVSIRDGFLYADSFIDLVVIDIQDPAQVVEVNRKENVFPWNQYQAVGSDDWFDADDRFGVVIAVTRR